MIKSITAAAALLLAQPALATASADCGETCLLDLATAYLDGLGVADASEVPFGPEHRCGSTGPKPTCAAGSGAPGPAGPIATRWPTRSTARP